MSVWYGDNPNCGRCGHLNSRGFCNMTACIFPCETGFGGYINKPQTNYDIIVSKTPYDLADWIAQILMYHGSFSRRPLTIDDNECPHECPLYNCCNDQPTDNIEEWLKSPVEDREVDK